MTGRITLLDDVVADPSLLDLRVLLRGDDDRAHPDRTPRSYSTVTWRLAVGTQPGQRAVLADLGQAAGHRCASAIGSGISSGVSSQAKPNIIPWSPAPSLRSGPRPRPVDALGDVGRLLLDRHDRAAGLVVEAVLGVV